MHTKASLLDDLRKTNIDPKGTLLIHSSMKAIGEVEGGGETVVDAVCEYMADGLLLFPTHSWSEKSLRDDIYDPMTEPSCVGILSNLFLKREGVLRSLHPTHSVAALGHKASTYIRRDDIVYTPCPRHGCIGGLYDEGAQILFLGASLKSNTYIHSLEEALNIPDRLNPKSRRIKIVEAKGHVREIDFNGHYSSTGDVSLNYDKLLAPMLRSGMAREVKIGDAISYIVDVRRMADWVVGLLKDNPVLFEDNRGI